MDVKHDDNRLEEIREKRKKVTWWKTKTPRLALNMVKVKVNNVKKKETDVKETMQETFH